jgi:hypothetical protein
MSEFLGPIAGWLGLLGLIGLLGLVGIRHPVSRERPGADVRLLGLLGLLGIAGFWIAGAGAAGALGALGVWNHQDPTIHRWSRLGWLGLVGLIFF